MAILIIILVIPPKVDGRAMVDSTFDDGPWSCSSRIHSTDVDVHVEDQSSSHDEEVVCPDAISHHVTPVGFPGNVNQKWQQSGLKVRKLII